MDNRQILALLKQMLESQGWKIFQDLSDQWRRERQKDKVNILRQCNSGENSLLNVARLQSKIDGSIYMTGGTDESGDYINSLLEDYIKLIKPSDKEENPSY